MKNKQTPHSGPIYVDVYIGGTPLLEGRLIEGLLEFGKRHPQWRFALRSADFRYTDDYLQQKRVDGVLALMDTSAIASDLNEANIPWVHLIPPGAVSHPYATVDDEKIGHLGAEFFLSKGFVKCAFCGVGTAWSEQRAAGFHDVLHSHDRSCQKVDIEFGTQTTWGLSTSAEKRLTKWLMSLDTGTAIMVAHDMLANSLVDLSLRLNLRIPQDIAILGVGNHDLPCQLCPVPISSIDANLPTLAEQGALMLKSLLDGHPIPNSLLIPPARLVERESTEVIAFGDDLISQALDYIRRHACEPITTDDLLAVLPVSRRTLSRRFAKYVGHSPTTEIRLTRVRKARDLLYETGMSLTEIAYTCGYADLSHMDRSFRQLLGAAPNQLKKNLP